MFVPQPKKTEFLPGGNCLLTSTQICTRSSKQAYNSSEIVMMEVNQIVH